MAKLSIFNVFSRDALPAEEIESTISLSPEDRYTYFLQEVTETGKVWVLCGDG